jgi:hypothetical protein
MTNPKDLKRSNSGNMAANMSEYTCKRAVQSYYRSVTGCWPSCKRTYLDKAGKATTDSKLIMKIQYDIKIDCHFDTAKLP